MKLRTGLLIATAVGCAAVPGAGVAQVAQRDSAAVLAGVVVGKEDGLPLGYSVVVLPAVGALGRERYTGARGSFAFAGLSPGNYRLRVKHLGYAPRELEVRLAAGRTEVHVELERVALRLAAVKVIKRAECTNPGPPDPALAPDFALLFEQVRQNAERYRLLTERYPYQYAVERTFSDLLRNGEYRIDRVDTVAYRSDYGWRYAPGQVLAVEGEGADRQHVLRLPTLADVVDSAFLGNHCFHYAGLDTLSGRKLVRVDFRAAKRLRTPDVDGSVYLDTATYQIRGDRVRLTRLPSTIRGTEVVTATTIFEEVVPSIPIRSFVAATNVLRPPPGPRARVSTVETQTLLQVRFLREVPGAADTPGAPPPSH